MELSHFFFSSAFSGTFRTLINTMMELFVSMPNGFNCFNSLTKFAKGSPKMFNMVLNVSLVILALPKVHA